jgi:hypothetical protein
MPHEYLSEDQIARYGRFPDELSVADLEQCFRLTPDALALARSKRTPATRLGWAVQWGTVRMLGVFQADHPTRVPERAAAFVADQLDVDPGALPDYRARVQTAYEHAWQIRDTFGYREFAAGEEDLRAYLAARVWAGEEGPRALFDRAVLYLIEHQILLPGLSVLSRLVRQARREENARLHTHLAARIPTTVHADLVNLLRVHDDARFSELERLRTEPDRVSSPGLVQALDRTSRIAGLGAGKVEAADMPQTKLEALARYGMRAKAPALADLTPDRQAATLLATVRHLETASVDDALDVLEVLITSKLLNRAVREGNEDKLRALPDLKSAAKKMAAAVDVLINTPQATPRVVSLAEVWNAIEEVVPREKLMEAVKTITEQVPDDDDEAAAWRARLVKRYRTVQGFIELLVQVIDFDAVDAGRPVLEALRTAAAMARSRKHYKAEDIAAHAALTAGSWKRPIFAGPGLEPGRIDKAAFIMCVIEHLHRALKRRDVFARGADRWGDPRARLLSGPAWSATRERVLTALELDAEPAGHLAALSSALEAGYTRVQPLQAAAEPPLMGEFRALVDAMMPRLDLPDLLMEVAARTGFPGALTHYSGAGSALEGFEASVCALLVAEACNIGLPPVVKPGVPALTLGRLQQVDHAYLRAETLRAANAHLIDAQAAIAITASWGGGLIASADGLRFVVPSQNLHARANPKYFGLRKRGATWLNVVNDQVMGLGGLVVPGTVRDSLYILDALHARDGGPKPEMVITDTASYSDIVFGLFAICGYQFSPRIADLADTRLWRTNTRASYGPLDQMSRHTIRLDTVRAHWADMLRVAGSLTTGAVRGYDLVRMLSREGRPTGLGCLHPLRAYLQDPAPAPVPARRALPAHDRRPAQRLRIPPRPGPQDLLRQPRRTQAALPPRTRRPARRAGPGPQRRGLVELPVHRRRRHKPEGRRIPRNGGDVRPAVPARVRPHQLPGLLHLPHQPRRRRPAAAT